MAEVRQVTLRMSARLVAKLEQLAERAHETPETFIEGCLAHYVRAATQRSPRVTAQHAAELMQRFAGEENIGYLYRDKETERRAARKDPSFERTIMTDNLGSFLAPVPLEHLESAEKAFGGKGTVFFGSNDYAFFRDGRVSEGAEVSIYASHVGEKPDAAVSWQAEYVRFVLHEDMTGADWNRRPPSADDDTPFVGYWEVRDLRQLEEPFPVSDLHDLSRRNFSVAFIPEGPTPVT